MNCFLSCSFSREDKEIVDWFQKLIEAHPNIKTLKADRDVPPPREQIDNYMENCDLICFIITKREGAPPPWILQEIEIARQKKLTMFAFVEDGLKNEQLGSLTTYVSFQQFNRENYSHNAPIYVRYIFNARLEALKCKKEDKDTLLSLIKSLKDKLEGYEEQLQESEEKRKESEEKLTFIKELSEKQQDLDYDP